MKNFIIFSSGPSLCHQDIDLCMKSGWELIAVNSTWKKVPECDVIYAGDYSWWNSNFDVIHSTAKLWTSSHIAAKNFGINLHVMRSGAFNSGLRAIVFAIDQGASNILLLGYDCSVIYGPHWHGYHASPLANPTIKDTERWKSEYAKFSDIFSRVNVINCSRYTELKIFKRMGLSDALSSFQKNNYFIDI